MNMICVGNKKVLDLYKKQYWYPHFVENTLKQEWSSYSSEGTSELQIKRQKLRMLFCCEGKDTLVQAFLWGGTPQGVAFWNKTSDALQFGYSEYVRYNKYVHTKERYSDLMFG